MGKIFGISDLPVTIVTTPLKGVDVPKVNVEDINWKAVAKRPHGTEGDVFVYEHHRSILERFLRRFKK